MLRLTHCLCKLNAAPSGAAYLDFSADFLPDGHKILPQTPSLDDLERTIALLMHPPAQPASPPLTLIVINLKWACALIGENNFKKLRGRKRT
jgi:hypothetical protein